MKKILVLIIAVAIMCLSLVGCKNEPHWSYQACIDELVTDEKSTYTVKEIEHQEVAIGDEEIYCFDIIITTEGESIRYCCFAVVLGGEVSYVDCDEWEYWE